VTLQERYKRLIASDTQQWIFANEYTDPQAVLLNPPKHLTNIKSGVVEQLLARKKARKKLPLWYQQPNILWPPPLSIEQASSETTAKFKASLIEGQKLVDFTGGTGIDLLAFSEHFETVTYVEKNEWLCTVFKHNANALNKKNIKIIHAAAENVLEQVQEGQWVYLDPARRDSQKKKVFLLEDCSPNLLEILPVLNGRGSKVMIKLSPLLDLQHIIKEIYPYRIVVLSVHNEVKELLVFVDGNIKEEVEIAAVDLKRNVNSIYTFRPASERSCKISYAPVAYYLYEPNVAILKAGAFKSIASTYNLHKLHPNTHLYTSNDLKTEFPGRQFRVLRELTGAELKSNYRESELHVIARNYPQNASQLTQKYKFKESGSKYLFAFTDHKEKKRLVLTELLKSDQPLN
jgi:hypothetical protein